MFQKTARQAAAGLVCRDRDDVGLLERILALQVLAVDHPPDVELVQNTEVVARTPSATEHLGRSNKNILGVHFAPDCRMPLQRTVCFFHFSGNSSK